MTREEAIERMCAYGVPQDEDKFRDALNRAIEALKQEPCEDCVSRQRLMKMYSIAKMPVGHWKAVDFEVIKNMPSVTPVQNWIPTSERLPKANEYVGNVAKHYLIQDEFGDMEVAVYTTRGWIPIHTIETFEYDVVAWQPLPKPYDEKEDEE